MDLSHVRTWLHCLRDCLSDLPLIPKSCLIQLAGQKKILRNFLISLNGQKKDADASEIVEKCVSGLWVKHEEEKSVYCHKQTVGV